MTTGNGKDQRTLPMLIGDLMRDAVVLVRQEIQLAKAEAAEKVSVIGSAIAAMAVGGLVLFAGFLVLLDAAVYFIAEQFAGTVPLWLSALLVGTGVTIIGLVLVLKARAALTAENLTPERTVRSLAQDADMLKENLP